MYCMYRIIVPALVPSLIKAVAVEPQVVYQPHFGAQRYRDCYSMCGLQSWAPLSISHLDHSTPTSRDYL